MDVTGRRVHVYVFDNPDAQQVFLDVTKVNTLDTYLFEEEQLPESVKNIPLKLHVGDHNVMLYTCCIDAQAQPGDSDDEKHNNLHQLVGTLDGAIKRALPDVHGTQLMSSCRPIDEVTQRLYPIVLEQEQLTRLASATGMKSISQMVAERDARAERRRVLANQRRRAEVLGQGPMTRTQRIVGSGNNYVGIEVTRGRPGDARRGQVRPRASQGLDGDVQEADGPDGAQGQEPPRQRRRVVPPYVMDIMGAAMASMLEAQGGDGVFVDLSAPPPAEPLPEQPEEAQGIKLSDGWEALLKPNKELQKTDDENFQCRACCKRVRTIITLPCRHQFYCDKCFRKHMSSRELHKTCPQCREPVTSIVRAFSE